MWSTIGSWPPDTVTIWNCLVALTRVMHWALVSVPCWINDTNRPSLDRSTSLDGFPADNPLQGVCVCHRWNTGQLLHPDSSRGTHAEHTHAIAGERVNPFLLTGVVCCHGHGCHLLHHLHHLLWEVLNWTRLVQDHYDLALVVNGHQQLGSLHGCLKGLGFAVALKCQLTQTIRDQQETGATLPARKPPPLVWHGLSQQILMSYINTASTSPSCSGQLWNMPSETNVTCSILLTRVSFAVLISPFCSSSISHL